MNRRICARAGWVVLVGALCAGGAHGGEPVAQTFVYQGQLKQDGLPVSGLCDFTFSLYRGDALIGTRVFSDDPERPAPLPVVNGLFQAALDFGDVYAAGGPLTLEIAVRCPSGAPVAMTTLSPPVPIDPVPLAYHAKTVESVDGHSLDGSDGSPANALFVDGEGDVGIGTSDPRSALHLIRNATEVGVKMKAAGSWTAELRQTDGSFLSLINGGSERLTVAPGGNVGIGTTAPRSRMDVLSGVHPQLSLRTSDEFGDDAGLVVQGARNGSTSAHTAYVELSNFDNTAGDDGTTYPLARIVGQRDSSAELTGSLSFHTYDGARLNEHLRIDSSGDIEISPKQRHLMLGPQDFIETFWGAEPRRGTMLTDSQGSGTVVYYAPLHVPDGAELIELRAWVLDNLSSGSQDVMIRLESLDPSTQTRTVMAEVETSGASAEVQELSTAIVSDAIVDNIVDNATSSYRVVALWNSFDDDPFGSNIGVAGVRVTYEVISPLP